MVSSLTQTGYPYFLNLSLADVCLFRAELHQCEGLRGTLSYSKALQDLIAAQALPWKARDMASSSPRQMREPKLGLLYLACALPKEHPASFPQTL